MNISLPGGFSEWLPEKQILETKIKEIIAHTYAEFGYIQIETPAAERTDILLAKGGDGISKQIYGLYGLAQGGEDLKDYSLHFDLTVPFARYTAEHANDLPFPFKRYQIQKVWRGERQQKYRYKEFYQCDIDIIGRTSLSENYHYEIISVLWTAYERIFAFLEKPNVAEFHVSDRRFLSAILDWFVLSSEQRKTLANLFDDYYKLENKEFIAKVQAVLDKNQFTQFQQISDATTGKILLEKLPEELSESKKLVSTIVETLQKRGIQIIFDPYIVRGLDYYTGIVFEVMMPSLVSMSVGGGGAYGNILKGFDNKTDYVGVGGSIGLGRFLSILDDFGFLEKRVSLSDILILNLENEALEYREQIATMLRTQGVRVDMYYEDDKLGKQFAYAEKKLIPKVLMIGSMEEKNQTVVIRDMQTKESKTVKFDSLIQNIQSKI